VVVSELSLGTMTFGRTMPPITKVDAALADRLVGTALDAGVNLFDTADTYGLGESEYLLGRALKSRRRKVIVATKFGFPYGSVNDSGLSSAHTIASVEASLRRLNTDWIDLLQLHRPDPLTPLDETLDALENLVRRGLVRYVGVCNYPAWQVSAAVSARRATGRPTLATAQVYWSLVGRDVEDEVVPMCEALGLGMLVWSPLAAGYLTAADVAGRRSSWEFPPVDAAVGDCARRALDEIASVRGISRARVALGWLLSKPVVSSILIGVSTVEQLTDNLAAADVELTSDELEQLNHSTQPAARYPRWLEEELPDALRTALVNDRRTPRDAIIG
jgi:aryl-alcohol dehydrogenase-like predicted oxidoreductase